MKKNKPQSNTPLAKSHRSFRRFARQLFASLLKRQSRGHKSGFQKGVMQKLRDIEEMLEIMAREMARRAKQSK